MNSENIVTIVVLVIVALSIAGVVGVSRAEAAKACYEAAKVNHNITCQQEPKA